MTGDSCCVKSGDDLKKTRSCDSTPARTADYAEEESSLGVRIQDRDGGIRAARTTTAAAW